MKQEIQEERIHTLSEISSRHAAREIAGCVSWRHLAVHQDRAWLLNAISKIRQQVENVRRARDEGQAEAEVEIDKLLDMFEEDTLDHLGD